MRCRCFVSSNRKNAVPRTLVTRAWCLVGQNGRPASLTPVVRFSLNDGTEQLRKGWDSADVVNAPHEWIEIEQPIDNRVRRPQLSNV